MKGSQNEWIQVEHLAQVATSPRFDGYGLRVGIAPDYGIVALVSAMSPGDESPLDPSQARALAALLVVAAEMVERSQSERKAARP